MSSDPSLQSGSLGRCYCGRYHLFATGQAQTVTYCHCGDCKRWTGAVAPVFAAFADEDIRIEPELDSVTFPTGSVRWCCPKCGSGLMAQFPYLPDQTYVPVGVLDDPDAYPPKLHCHAQGQVSWLHLDDGLPRDNDSGRDMLQASKTS